MGLRGLIDFSPNELHLQTTREADVGRLIDAAKMCHKYTLPLFETWALKMIVVQCQPPLNRLGTCTQDVLERVMSLATLCEHPELLRLVELAWLSRLHTGELRCSDALAAGEKYGRRKFQGDVYYHLNKQIHSIKASTLAPANARGFSDLGLTDAQLLRLLSGHVLLSNFCCRLRVAGLPYSPRCNVLKYMHSVTCVPAYLIIQWPADTADVLAELKAAREAVRALPAPAPFGVPTCVGSHLDMVIERFSGTEIAEYFLGPERSCERFIGNV